MKFYYIVLLFCLISCVEKTNIVEEIETLENKLDLIEKENIIEEEYLIVPRQEPEIELFGLNLFNGITNNYEEYKKDPEFNYTFIDYSKMSPQERDNDDPVYEIIVENNDITIKYEINTKELKKL